MTDKDGKPTGTQREHLERSARGTSPTSARARATLAAHPVPALLASLWRRFLDLSHWRGGGGFGASPITLHDVEAWERRFGYVLMPGELDVVKALDMAMLTEAA